MLVPNQLITIKWGRTNITYYKNLGYHFTKLGDSFEVKAEDLMTTSKAKVQVMCDTCGKMCVTTYQSFLISLNNNNGKYYCRNCSQKNIATREKIKSTFLEKYGSKNITTSDYFKEKAKDTNLKKLGVEYPSQSKEVKEKIKATYLQHNRLIGFQNKDTLLKAQNTIANSGQVIYSRQQKELYDILKEKYECSFNKPLENLNLDIEVILNDIMIDIEVDGHYWHKDPAKDRKRDEFVKTKGYKILRIKINRTLPSIEIIEDAINKLVSSDHTFYQIEAADCKNKNKNNKDNNI